MRGFSRRVLVLSLAVFGSLLNNGVVRAEDDPSEDAPVAPNIYVNFDTVFALVPGNTFSLGFRGFSTALSGQSSKSLTFNAPLTIDLTERLSVFGGVSGVTSQSEGSSWSSLALNSWNVGFTADVIEQSDLFPMVSIQSTLTRTIQASAFGLATSSASVLELNYGTDEDQTRGFLGGVKVTRIFPDSRFVKIQPGIIGYVGGYYQWSNNWQVYARGGVQHFGGADVASLIKLAPFTGPIVQIQFNKVDDNANTLFGVTAEISWVPKPSFQFTLNTPLYFVRN